VDKYYLSSNILFSILKEKGVEYLYHANTVLTSLTFIENQALLSRAYVTNNGLVQTPQKSDKEDKAYKIWDDVFLDGLDLHKKYLRPNDYGPVLFVIKLDLLLSQSIPTVLITKNNPWYWNLTDSLDDRYYSSIDDVNRDYLNGTTIDSRIMFTFRMPETAIKLNKYLEFIGIDRPPIIVELKSRRQKNIGDFALEKITEAAKKNGLGHIPIVHRHISGIFDGCACYRNYTDLYETNFAEFKKRFKVDQ